MQAFTLDHDSAIPVKVQLKAQVVYQVAAGLVRPGDQLPPLRDLAAGLSIHLNTVVRAFDELEAEGYLVSQHGRGVFVADEPPALRHGAALRSLMAGVLQSAREWGMAPEAMALAALAHGSLARPPGAAPHRLLLVGGSRPWLSRLQGELEAALPVAVVPALADEVEERTRVADFRVVACSLFHQAEVHRFLPRARTVVLATHAEQEALAALGHLEPGTPVGVAARDWVEAARIRRSLDLAGLGTPGITMAAGESPGALERDLGACQTVLAAAGAASLVRQAVSAQTTILAEPLSLPAAALADLRQALDAPRTQAPVHVRSAWV